MQAREVTKGKRKRRTVSRVRPAYDLYITLSSLISSQDHFDAEKPKVSQMILILPPH